MTSEDQEDNDPQEWDSTGFQERHSEDWHEDVEIRSKINGVAMYAVFDGDEKVSSSYGPIDDKQCVHFARGYSTAKEKQ